jgi:hypothetical protein
MKGDALNLTRALSLRLSIAFASSTLAALYVFVSGNLGGLSDDALLASVRALGGTGFIAAMFGTACVGLSLWSIKSGARLPALSIIIGVLMSFVGIAGAILSSFMQVVTGGISL